MATTSLDKVVGLALSNPKFRKQLLDNNIDNATLFKTYGIKPSAALVTINKAKLVDAIKDRLNQRGWCVGNACGVGT